MGPLPTRFSFRTAPVRAEHTQTLPESGANGTFYLHPNPTGAVNLGDYWASKIYADLFAPPVEPGTVTTNVVTRDSVGLTSTSANEGFSPYSYQWYRSTLSGFEPSSSNVISGATSLTLNDSGLTSNTTCYYVLGSVDSAIVRSYSAQQAVTTSPVTTISTGFGGGAPGEGKTFGYGSIGSVAPPIVAPTYKPIDLFRSALVSDLGTYYIVGNSSRFGITNPGILKRYGYSFAAATPISAAQAALPTSSNLPPNDGALVKASSDPTIYLISNGGRHGFTSEKVFISLGYKLSSVLTVTTPELNQLHLSSVLNVSSEAHLLGTNILLNGTVYQIGTDDQLHGYPSLAVYNSWNIPNDFSTVVPANAADQKLVDGSAMEERT